MKISVTATLQLQKELDEVQRRCKERMLTAKDIQDILSGIPVPKIHLDGTKVHWDGSEKMPRAYKYTPQSTHFTAVNAGGKWYVVDLYRASCPNRVTKGEIEYSDRAKAWIIENASVL